MDFGLWSPELAREETVVVAPACRQPSTQLKGWLGNFSGSKEFCL